MVIDKIIELTVILAVQHHKEQTYINIDKYPNNSLHKYRLLLHAI